MIPQQQSIGNNNGGGQPSTTVPHYHQLIKFNVGGKILYTTRETILNSFHHSAIYKNHNQSNINELVFPGNCLPFSQKIRSPTAYQLAMKNYLNHQQHSNTTTTTTNTTNTTNSTKPTTSTTTSNTSTTSTNTNNNVGGGSNNQHSTSSGDLSNSNPNNSVYNSLSTFVDLHNRKSRMSFSEGGSGSGNNNNNRPSSLSSTSTSNGVYENYFTRLLDENQHLGFIKDENGCYFIDRNPKYFALILEYLKSGELNLFDSSEYRSSELDTPEYGFHDLQLFAQKIIKESDYFMLDVSDQLFNIVGDQLYVSDCFQDRTNRSNQRCLIFFDKDPLRRPCSLYMNGIWFDKHIVDKECFVRNGVIEIYMDENNSNEYIGRKKKPNQSLPSQQYSSGSFGQGSSGTTDFDADSESLTKRKSYDSNTFFNSLSNMVSNISTQNNGRSQQKSGPLRLQFVIHPQVDVKNNEKANMMNFIGVDPSLLDINAVDEKSKSNPNDVSSLFSTYGMLGASRRLSMEFPQLVENVLVVKDINSFKKEFRLIEMTEPAITRIQFNKKYFNLSDYNHSIKIVRDEKDPEHVTVVEHFTQIPEKFGSNNIENNPNIPANSPVGGGLSNLHRRVNSEVPLRNGNQNNNTNSPVDTTATHLNSESKNILDDVYVEVVSSDDDEFSVPQPISSKRKSLNPNAIKSKPASILGTKAIEQTRETRMRVIANNFLAKSKKEFLYIESKNRIYWVSNSRGLITLELSNKNL